MLLRQRVRVARMVEATHAGNMGARPQNRNSAARGLKLALVSSLRQPGQAACWLWLWHIIRDLQAVSLHILGQGTGDFARSAAAITGEPGNKSVRSCKGRRPREHSDNGPWHCVRTPTCLDHEKSLRSFSRQVRHRRRYIHFRAAAAESQCAS
jgi:hypothetical protein